MKETGWREMGQSLAGVRCIIVVIAGGPALSTNSMDSTMHILLNLSRNKRPGLTGYLSRRWVMYLRRHLHLSGHLYRSGRLHLSGRLCLSGHLHLFLCLLLRQ